MPDNNVSVPDENIDEIRNKTIAIINRIQLSLNNLSDLNRDIDQLCSDQEELENIYQELIEKNANFFRDLIEGIKSIGLSLTVGVLHTGLGIGMALFTGDFNQLIFAAKSIDKSHEVYGIIQNNKNSEKANDPKFKILCLILYGLNIINVIKLTSIKLRDYYSSNNCIKKEHEDVISKIILLNKNNIEDEIRIINNAFKEIAITIEEIIKIIKIKEENHNSIVLEKTNKIKKILTTLEISKQKIIKKTRQAKKELDDEIDKKIRFIESCHLTVLNSLPSSIKTDYNQEITTESHIENLFIIISHFIKSSYKTLSYFNISYVSDNCFKIQFCDKYSEIFNFLAINTDNKLSIDYIKLIQNYYENAKNYWDWCKKSSQSHLESKSILQKSVDFIEIEK